MHICLLILSMMFTYRNQHLSTKFPVRGSCSCYFICSMSTGIGICSVRDIDQISEPLLCERLGELGGSYSFHLFYYLCMGVQHWMSVCSGMAVANWCDSCVLGVDWPGHLHIKVTVHWDLRAHVHNDLLHISQNVDFDCSSCCRIWTHFLHGVLWPSSECKPLISTVTRVDLNTMTWLCL